MKRLTAWLLPFLFFLLTPYAPAQDRAYLYCDLLPDWQVKAVEYWNSSTGYGKKIPEQMIAEINRSLPVLANNLQIKINEKVFRAGIFDQVVRTVNPTTIALQPADLYIDLVCGIRQVSNTYPFFRAGLASIKPVMDYYLVIYDAGGEKLLERELAYPVDYRQFRDQLKGLADHERDIKIVTLSYEQSFTGNILDNLTACIAEARDLLERKPVQGDPARFHKEMSLLFENRKISYPEYYAGLNIPSAVPVSAMPVSPATQPAAGTATAGAEYAAYGDVQLSHQLAELIRSVKNYALIIGVNEYRDPKINDLAEPVNDAIKLAEVLLNYYTYEPSNVIFLKDPTRAQIIQSFDYLSTVVTPDDNLLIFYAGHGLWDDQLKKGFWFPADANHNNRANWFSNSDLRDYIGGINSHHTLLISDACFSGGIFKTREVFTGVTQATLELYKLPSRKAMTSGAMTTVPDQSVFLEYLIKRLAENREHFFSSEQLFASFKIAVINNSPTSQVPQFGEIRETGDEGGDFLFIRK